MIAGLGDRFDADETAIIERMFRNYGGTVPEAQLAEETGLALAIHRRRRSGYGVQIAGAGAAPDGLPAAV